MADETTWFDDTNALSELIKALCDAKVFAFVDFIELESMSKITESEWKSSRMIEAKHAKNIVRCFKEVISKKEGYHPSKRALPLPVNMVKIDKSKTFEEVFEDLSDTPYHPGDFWNADACTLAFSGLPSNFEEVWNKTTGDCPENYANITNVSGWSPILYAANHGNRDVVEQLLEDGADMRMVNFNGQNALMLAASNNHCDFIKAMVEHAKEYYDDKPFIIANVIGLHMADNENKYTALHYAAYYANYDVVVYLLNLGANPNKPDINGNTPTLIACADPAQERCLKALCQKGGRLDICNLDKKDGVAIGENRPSLCRLRDRMKKSESPAVGTQQPRYGYF